MTYAPRPQVSACFRHSAATTLALLASALFSPVTAHTVGFAQVGSESEWRVAFSRSMIDTAKARGITMLFSDADGSREKQIAAVRSFIEQRVDAIIIAPVVMTGWDEVLTEAKAAGMPVFIADRMVDADPSLFVARIAANFNFEGKIAAAWLALKSRGRCDVLELQGTTGSAAAIERRRGFESVVSQFPGIRIGASYSGNFTRAGGKATMERILAAPGGMQGACAVFAHNDDMMLGAIEAMKAHGLEPGKQPLTISIDFVQEAKRAIAACELNASVELKSDIGDEIFDVVQGYLAGRRDWPKWIVIPSDIHEGDARACQ